MKKLIVDMDKSELQEALLKMITCTLSEEKAKDLSIHNAYLDLESRTCGKVESIEFLNRTNARVDVVNENTGEIRQFYLGDTNVSSVLSRLAYVYGLFSDSERAKDPFWFELSDGDGRSMFSTKDLSEFRTAIRTAFKGGMI